MEPEELNLSSTEKLEVENEALKLRMMLEYGAQFGGGDLKLPPEVENQFLRNILAIEQMSQGKKVKVYDKIGRPTHFRPVTEISDAEIEEEWDKLRQFMAGYSFQLFSMGGELSPREFYRYTTEQLFKTETEEFDIEGVITAVGVDSGRGDFEMELYFAAARCLSTMLIASERKFDDVFSEIKSFNGRDAVTNEEVQELVKIFRKRNESLKIADVDVLRYDYSEQEAILNGVCKLEGKYKKEEIYTWMMEFRYVEEIKEWKVVKVRVEGLEEAVK